MAEFSPFPEIDIANVEFDDLGEYTGVVETTLAYWRVPPYFDPVRNGLMRQYDAAKCLDSRSGTPLIDTPQAAATRVVARKLCHEARDQVALLDMDMGLAGPTGKFSEYFAAAARSLLQLKDQLSPTPHNLRTYGIIASNLMAYTHPEVHRGLVLRDARLMRKDFEAQELDVDQEVQAIIAVVEGHDSQYLRNKLRAQGY